QKLTSTMKTSGATRKKPSQRKPGRPQARVTSPPLRPPRVLSPSAFSAFGRCCPRSASASSISSTAIRVASSTGGSWGGSGPEELDILLLPRDADLLTLLAPEGGIALAGHLCQHALASRGQMQLDEVAEELHEDDLALHG